MSLNKVMLIGNAGKDPDIRHMENGVVFASLPLATTERYKDKDGNIKEQTEWHNIVFWRRLAEIVERYVRKGSQLYIEGRIRSRSWEDQSGQKRYITEIVAENMELLGRKQENSSSSVSSSQSSPSAQVPADADDLPF